jgi:cytochrome c5
VRVKIGLLMTTAMAVVAFAAVEELPEGEGKKVVVAECGSCHAVDRVTELHQDRDAWNTVVKKMVEYGSKIREADIPVAVEYLTKNFGPRAAAPPQSEVERTANKHIEGICSTCHNASLIRETEATKEGWLDIVKTMNSKGAGLSDADVELLADYLARKYPKRP